MAQPDVLDALAVEQQTLLSMQIVHPVTPPSPPQVVSAVLAADGVTLTVTFDTTMYVHPPATDVGSAHTVTADAVGVPLAAGGTLVGDTMVLTLSEAIIEGQEVLLSYSGGYLTSAVYSTWGVLEAYEDYLVVNNSEQTGVVYYAGNWTLLHSVGLSAERTVSIAVLSPTRFAVAYNTNVGTGIGSISVYDVVTEAIVHLHTQQFIPSTTNAVNITGFDGKIFAAVSVTAYTVSMHEYSAGVVSQIGSAHAAGINVSDTSVQMGEFAVAVAASTGSGPVAAYTFDGSAISDAFSTNSLISTGGTHISAVSDTRIAVTSSPGNSLRMLESNGSAFSYIGNSFTFASASTIAPVAGMGNGTQVAVLNYSSTPKTISLYTYAHPDFVATGTPLTVTASGTVGRQSADIAHLGGGYVVTYDKTSDAVRLFKVT